ncbi:MULTISPECIES: serine hydrolase domain-containing protein [unclassified Sphingopyxis]|uniref:serine hydrolase domain-containing protein n=1 Tax=unclassified Sphingopyxis TaxID=2614943 RepID=UPI000735E158|nr:MULTISPECIES: serine hydrolase domain-containing protein [unclassified Sphingopyxis]KTE41899.1 penicillin-binding protein [Sphingopyxis sp. HIX]KTE83588.1 penicillin-binding protein [Sphingopyxis sp. HXXIV]
MRLRSGLFFAVILGASFPAAAEDPAPKTLDQLAPEIDALFAKYQADAHVPGLVYGIVQDGKLVYVKGAGVQDLDARRPVTADSRFRIASMTKAFTALAILKLRDDGKLRLDDLAEDHIPEMKGWTYPTKDSPRIRIRDLLQHVGGFVTDDPWGDRQQVLPQADFTKMIAAGVPFSRVPQGAHEYSNFGYALLGRIVANASGMAYTDYVQKTILTPLGMTASGFDVTKTPKELYARGYRWENDAWAAEPEMADGAFNAMGGLQVSANDYAKWIAFLLSAWPARDDPDTGPVRRATVREMAQGLNFTSVANRIGASGADACKQSLAYGMGWRVAQDCELGLTMAHGGGYPGYGSHVMLMPETGTGVFALANRTYAGPSGPAWDSAVAMDKAGLLQWRDTPASPAVTEMFAAAQAAYAAGNLAPLDGRLAMNFLMDRSAANWAAELAKLKDQLGACPTAEPLAPMGAMATAFRLNCEKGKLDGMLLLAPTTPVTIQALRLRVVPD